MFQVNCFHHTLIFMKFCIFSKSILTLETIRWPSRKDQPRFQQRQQQQQWLHQPIWDIPQEMQFQHQNLYLLEKPPSFRANLQVQQCEKRRRKQEQYLGLCKSFKLVYRGPQLCIRQFVYKFWCYIFMSFKSLGVCIQFF